MDFAAAYPSYSRTASLDDVRMREHPLLDAQGHIYLDYTAANLPPRSLITRHANLLREQILGNPALDESSLVVDDGVDRAYARAQCSSSSTLRLGNGSWYSQPTPRRR